MNLFTVLLLVCLNPTLGENQRQVYAIMTESQGMRPLGPNRLMTHQVIKIEQPKRRYRWYNRFNPYVRIRDKLRERRQRKARYN